MQKEKKDKHFIKKPVFPGGQEALKKFIRDNMRYPKGAVNSRIEGTVSLKYTINHQGKVIDAKVIKGLGYGCDEEAIRLARLLKFEVPKTRNLKVQFHKDLHVHFRLPKTRKTSPKYHYQVTEAKDQDTPEPSKKSYNYSIVISRKS